MISTTTGKKLTLAVAGAASAVLLAAGCSVGVDGSAGSASSAPTAAESSTVTTPSASSAAPASTSATADDNDDITDPEWLDAIANSQKTIPATATTTITESDAVLTVDGDCDVLSVQGSGNTIVVDDATTIDITGSGNTVFVDEVSRVTLTGSDNTIVWDDEPEPTVEEVGSDNVIRRAR